MPTGIILKSASHEVSDEVREKKVLEHERVKELIAEFRRQWPAAPSRSS